MKIYYKLLYVLIFTASTTLVFSEDSVALDGSPQPLSSIPVYRVVIDTNEVPSDFIQKCDSRSIQLTSQDDFAYTEWTHDRAEAHKIMDHIKRMGAFNAKIQVSGIEYNQLLNSQANKKEQFAIYTDLIDSSTSNQIDSSLLLNQFQELQQESGTEKEDLYNLLADHVVDLAMMRDDQIAQYLAGMGYYIQGQIEKAKHDLTLTSFSFLPHSAKVIRSLNTGYHHMLNAAKMDGPLQEESMYECSMIAYEISEHGDLEFRAKQGIYECNRYLENYPSGKHAVRVSVYRLDFLRSLYLVNDLDDEVKTIRHGLALDYINQLLQIPITTKDPSVYEHVLTVLKPMEIYLEIGNNQALIDLYNENYGHLTPDEFPASTYWMFAIIWNYVRTGYERLDDYENALKYTELRLKPAPDTGNAWPQFGPVNGPIGMYKAAINYAQKLGESEKVAFYQNELSKISN